MCFVPVRIIMLDFSSNILNHNGKDWVKHEMTLFLKCCIVISRGYLCGLQQHMTKHSATGTSSGCRFAF